VLKSRRQSVCYCAERTELAGSVADIGRTRAPRGGRDGHASPAPCPVRPSQATAHYFTASARPIHPVPYFVFPQPLSSPTAAAELLQRHRHR